MPRPLRAEIFDPSEITIVHCVQRCVRRTFLAGFDPTKKVDYQYRREWIRARIEKLASVFGIDCLSYSIMSNHMHVVIRSRPDIVKTWSNRLVALRWLQIFPGKRIDEQLGDPTVEDVDALANNSERIAKIRLRLSNFSWFMRALSEPIARQANRDENAKGHFWEGRFKATKILDEASLLACCMYVDLNPIRAAMATTPETSLFTSVYDRIEAQQGKKIESSAAPMQVISKQEAAEILKESTPKKLEARRRAAKNRKGPKVLRDAWLAPLTLDAKSNLGPMPSSSGQRASDKGYLNMSFKDYLQLLEWTGRQGKLEKRGAIPNHLAPILQRLGLEPSMWCDLVWQFRRYFGRNGFAGAPNRMRDQARVNQKAYSPGQRLAELCFLT